MIQNTEVNGANTASESHRKRIKLAFGVCTRVFMCDVAVYLCGNQATVFMSLFVVVVVFVCLYQLQSSFEYFHSFRMDSFVCITQYSSYRF